MEKGKKKFKLMDAILGTVCLTLVCESVMPTAAIGNTQYFWWIFLLVAFCLPYGMITAELGTAYPSEGGMYDWVKRAFGPKWAGRVAWNYWINFPLWIASLAVAVTDIIAGMFNIELSVGMLLLIQLAYVWLVTFLGTKRIGESKYIVNLGTFFKIVLLLGIGLLGIYAVIRTGQSANPITGVGDLFPSFDLESWSFISIILFNFMEFEVVGTWAEDMDDPKKDIPKALIFGGLLMAIFYVLPATGFNIALSPEVVGNLDPENVVEVLLALFGAVGLSATVVKAIVIIAGFMFIYTFIANIASWSFGVNEVAKYAAEDGSMPKIFTKTNSEDVPYMASIINGIVASLIVVGGIIANTINPIYGSSFELLFHLSWLILLISYIPMFLAFLKLRKEDTKTKKVYKIPGNNRMIKVMAIIPFVILIAGILLTLFGDFTLEFAVNNIPLIMGIVISFICEEILMLRLGVGKNTAFISMALAFISTIMIFILKELKPVWITLVIGCLVVCACSLLFSKKQAK